MKTVRITDRVKATALPEDRLDIVTRRCYRVIVSFARCTELKRVPPGNIRTFLVLSSDYGETNHKMNTDRTESNIHDSYRGVVLVLLTTAALGTMTALVGGLLLANPGDPRGCHHSGTRIGRPLRRAESAARTKQTAASPGRTSARRRV
jgi:hypothetical protein